MSNRADLFRVLSKFESKSLDYWADAVVHPDDASGAFRLVEGICGKPDAGLAIQLRLMEWAGLWKPRCRNHQVYWWACIYHIEQMITASLVVDWLGQSCDGEPTPREALKTFDGTVELCQRLMDARGGAG